MYIRFDSKHLLFHLISAAVALLVGFGVSFWRMEPLPVPAVDTPGGKNERAAAGPQTVEMGQNRLSPNDVANAYLGALERAIIVNANSEETAVGIRESVRHALNTPRYRFDSGDGKTIALLGAARLFAAHETLEALSRRSTVEASTASGDTTVSAAILVDKVLAAAADDAKEILRTLPKKVSTSSGAP